MKGTALLAGLALPLALLATFPAAGLADEADEVDTSPEGELLRAMIDADSDAFLAALEEGADPNFVGKEGWTMLMRASHLDNPVDSIAQLVAAGAKVNKRKKDGGAAILYAAEWGKLDAVKALLKEGANPNFASTVKKDVAVGPQGQKATSGGNTALHAATWSGNAAMVEVLVEGGADITHKNADGETPRDVAVKNGLTELIKVIDPTDTVRDEDLTGCEKYSNCGECTDGGCAWCLSMPRTGKAACTLDKPRVCSSKENHIGKANPNSPGCPVEEVELAEEDAGKSEL